MTRQDYLDRLEDALKGLTPEEQSSIIEEIESHFSEGESDTNLGNYAMQRLEKLSGEMGEPEDLGRRMMNVHRPKRWLEFLLVILPQFVLFPLLSLCLAFILPSNGSTPTSADLSSYLSIRFSILSGFCLVVISSVLYKKQGLVTGFLFWITSLWLSIFSMCFREERWTIPGEFNGSTLGIAESIFWNLALVVLLLGLLKVLWKTRDPLWFTLVSIPCLTTLGNLATSLDMISGQFTQGYSLPTWRLFGYFGLHQVAYVIWPAIFIFCKQRHLRWLALLIYATPLALMNVIASTRYPALMALWTIPILTVALGWFVDTLFGEQKQQIIR